MKITKQRLDAFLAAVEALCREHGLSIAHEDSYGGFIITEFNEEDAKHFREDVFVLDGNPLGGYGRAEQ